MEFLTTDDAGIVSHLKRRSFIRISALAAAAFLSPSSLLAKARSYRVFVGTETGQMPAMLFGEHGKSEGIYTFLLDSDTGEVTAPSLAAEVSSPWTLATGRGGRFLYAHLMSDMRNSKESRIVAYAVGAAGLRKLNEVSSGGLGASRMTLDPTGRFLLTCSFATDAVVAIQINGDGTLGPRTDRLENAPAPVPKDISTIPPAPPVCSTVERTPHDACRTKPHDVVLSPGGGFALVPEINSAAVAVYRFDQASGALSLHGMGGGMPPGSAPRHLAFGKSGAFAYTSDERGSSVSAWSWDESRGRIRILQTLPTAPPDYIGSSQYMAAPIKGDHKNFPADIGVHPEGRLLWVSNRGHPSIAGFSIDPMTGLLTENGYTMTNALQCWSFDITPDGEWLLAGLQTSDEVAVFMIKKETGKLIERTRIRVPFPTSVKIAPTVPA